jgi:hypothetical protein
MTSQFDVVDQGIVSRRIAGTATATAAGPRCAVLPDGELVCTFIVQAALGRNDFKPVLTRSKDGGRTWLDERFIWPELADQFSIFGAISATPRGELYFFGTRYRIDRPGEPVWSDATTGLKENEMFWSRSTDRGRTWSAPVIIPMVIPGAAEAPGPLCITRSGRWICCYAPYNTFDPNVKVDRNQLAGMSSDDHGRTWNYRPIMRFPQPSAGCAEAWIVQLTDGRLLSACWNFDYAASDFPNAYAISDDDGRNWQGPFSTGTHGQSIGLVALSDARVALLYNQRKKDPAGVRLAVARPTASDFNIESDQAVWQAQVATQGASSSVSHENFMNFAFGEPSGALLQDGDLLVFLWCVQPEFTGIQSVRVRCLP